VWCAIDKVFSAKMRHCRRYRSITISGGQGEERSQSFTASAIVMLRYIENIDTSFRYRCMESYRIGRFDVDLSAACCHARCLFLTVDFTFLDSNAAGNEEFS